MGKYQGAVCRHCRREGVKLFLKGEKCYTKCTLDRRAMPPGMHTQVRRRKVSDYGIQLRGKQRAVVPWLSLDKDNMTAKCTAQPGRDDMDQTIQEQLIVEFYSR